ncbi:hypothetical protein BDF21DRAFT_460986 [Thamnidium elegans]|nr:hypothetical protein BDF21DRAFT_460986 [Thamnidium elegans]
MSAKESSSSKDTGYTTLPLKWIPVKDLLSKELLKDSEIMNLIIRSLLDKDDEFPPIIIEIQFMVDVIVTSSFSSTKFQNQFILSNKLNPMAALGFFTTKHKVNEMPEKNRADPSYVLLSSVVKKILSKNTDGNIDKNNLSYRLQQIKRNFEACNTVPPEHL